MAERNTDDDACSANTSVPSNHKNENGTISNNNNNNKTKSLVLDGAKDENPRIIEVHGVIEDKGGPEYTVEKMGSLVSAEDDPNSNEQCSPLTQSEPVDTSKTLNQSEEDSKIILNQSEDDTNIPLNQSEPDSSRTLNQPEEDTDRTLNQSEQDTKGILNQSADKNEEDQSKIEETKVLDETDGNGTFVEVNNGANTTISGIIPEIPDTIENIGDKLELEPRENGSKTESGTKDENGTRDETKLAGSSDGTFQNKAAGKKEEEIVVDIVCKDDIDAASTLSFFMDRKDFRYYFQHPYFRMLLAYLVVFLNFFIYAEDPVAHSRKECMIPMIGNDFAFVTNRYPPNAWSLLKVVLWLTGLVIGLFVGKLFIHSFLFTKLFRLKMFSDDQGSWMVMFMCSLISIFVMSLVYNLFLMIGGDSTEDYRISDLMGVKNDIFTKAAACGTWCGDFFTAWMVTDIMLQEKLYPDWAKPVRRWWKRGYNRMILFWVVVVICWFIVVFVIATDHIQWDKLNRGFMPTNELSRAFLASFILVLDLCIVMQDWDFPHFVSAIDIKLPGLNTAHIRFQIPKCMKRETWTVHITGKWFNYGILFIVMILDMNMWKNQIFYSPYDYGQYTGPEGRIYTVQDDFSLENFNETLTTYSYRSVTINPDTNQTYLAGDTQMNTKYLNRALAVKGIAFVPSIIAFIVFGILIWQFGRFKPTADDPYAGRLKKRIKKRFSFRMPWRRRDEVRRKVHAVPKLLYFRGKRKDGDKEEGTEIPTKGFVAETGDKQIVTESTNTTVQQD